MIPSLPIDFAAIAAYGAVMLGQVAAGAAGVVTVQSLIRAGFRYVEQSFTGMDVEGERVRVIDVDAESVHVVDVDAQALEEDRRGNFILDVDTEGPRAAGRRMRKARLRQLRREQRLYDDYQAMSIKDDSAYYRWSDDD